MALPTFGLTQATNPVKTGNVSVASPATSTPSITTSNVSAVASTSQKNSTSTYYSNYAGTFSGVFGLSYLTNMINQVSAKQTPPPANRLPAQPPPARLVVPVVPPPAPPTLFGRRTGTNDYRKFDTTKIRLNDADAYQSLTGISQQRPELITLTTFNPIFVDSYQQAKQQVGYSNGDMQWLTPAGKFFDTATQARGLKHHNLVKLLTTTIDDHVEARDAATNINDEINQSLSDVQEISSYARNALFVVKNLKDGLDPRHLLSSVNDEQIDKIRQYYVPSTVLLNGTSRQSSSTAETSNAKNLLSLMGDLGYVQNSLKAYSATKIWLQMLVELRQSLKYQTRTMLDLESTLQQQDNDPSNVLLSRDQQFDLSPMILPASSDMSNLVAGQEESLSQLLETAYYNFSLSTRTGRVFDNNTAKCATLFDFLAKDYRYSTALGSREFLDMMQTSFGFTPNVDSTVGNESMIDYVIGPLPNNSFDVPVKNESNSLSSLAQTSAGNLAIKTFENTYVQARAGTLTPGTAYYGDSIFSLTTDKTFDVSNLQTLNVVVSRIYDSFGKFVKLTNSSPWSAGSSELELSRFETITLADKMTNGSAVVRELANQLLMGVDNPNFLSPIWEPAASLFSHVYESNDAGLKSDLFLFVFYLMLEKQQMVTVPKNATVPIPQPAERSVPNGVTPAEAPAVKALLDVILNRNASPTSTLSAQPPPAVTPQKPKFSDYFLDRISKKLQQLQDLTDSAPTPVRGSMKEVNDSIMSSNLRDVMFKSQPRSLKPFIDVIVDFLRNVFEQYKNDALVNGLSRYNVISDVEFLMILFEAVLAVVAGSCGRKFVGKKLENSSWQYIVRTAKFSREGQSPWQFVNSVIRRFDSRQDSMIWYVFLELEQLKSRIESTLSALKSSEVFLTKMEKYVSLQDPTQQLMFKEHQLDMLVSNSIDYMDEFKNSTSNERVRLLDSTASSDSVVQMIKALLGQDDFLQGKGFNKKIASIGIPVGFYELLKFSRETYKQNVGYDAKQQDIISVNVYATDMLKPDVIFKPIKHYFEISRFPVRSSSKFLSIPSNPSIIDIVRAIPTRDVSQNSIDPVPQYYDPDQPGLAAMFDDETYSFISSDVKWQIARNHVLSYLFESYVRNMTGVDVSERAFPFIDSTYKVKPEFVELLFQCRVNDYAYAYSRSTRPQRSNILLGNNLGVFDYTNRDVYGNKKISTSLNPTSVALEATPARFTDQLLHELSVLFDYSTSWTSLSDGPTFARFMLSTKKFDRVLHVMIDPDDFRIDVEKTTSTATGKSLLNSLLMNNEVETKSDGSLAFVEKASNDASMYSYFVNLESYDPSKDMT